MSHPSLPPEQRTMTTRQPDGDLLREPIPGMEVCDFCNETPVTWAYPCGPVNLGVSVTTDPWAACDECHALIEADDRPGLSARSLRLAMKQGAPREAGAMFAELHLQFFAARQGDPRPL